MCRFSALWRLTLPEAVSLKRFTAPRLLFSFKRTLGFLIVSSLLGLARRARAASAWLRRTVGCDGTGRAPAGSPAVFLARVGPGRGLLRCRRLLRRGRLLRRAPRALPVGGLALRRGLLRGAFFAAAGLLRRVALLGRRLLGDARPSSGERICTMVLPSFFGGDSTLHSSPSSSASRSRCRRPTSMCTTSRPRKITTDFTLLPPFRKRSAFRSLNWKSCSSIFGRNFTSFDLDVSLVLPRLRLPLRLLVEELPGVHDPADRRGRGGRDLHEVHALLLREHQGLRRRHDSELRAVLVDDTDLSRPDAVVDPNRPAVYETPPAL